MLNREPYRELEVRSSTIEYGIAGFGDRPTVTLTLTRTSGPAFPDLPQVLDREIIDRTGRDVIVQVQFVDYHQSDPGAT